MTMFAAISITISLLLFAGTAAAQTGCEAIEFEETPFTVCQADPAQDDIRLFLNNDEGTPLGSFRNVEAQIEAPLQFAMNAGMYHSDRRPVGLYIEDGAELARIVTSDGPGNFGLLPNGVLCLMDGATAVIEAREFKDNPPECRFATQSGPMLVIDGELHPRFLENSDSLNVRNGVGVTPEGTMITAISDTRVNFHQFARLFRDVLNTPNALFLDGNVSRLYAPEVGRNDLGFPMGPMLGVVAPAD